MNRCPLFTVEDSSGADLELSGGERGIPSVNHMASLALLFPTNGEYGQVLPNLHG